MSIVTVNEASLEAIADAIRAKNGEAQTYTPGQMPAAIGRIPTGSTAVLVAKTITENGTYQATDDDADGYSSVTVDVPTSSPNLQSKTVTQNGTVTPDAGYEGLSSVVVNVPAGSGQSYTASAGQTTDFLHREAAASFALAALSWTASAVQTS